MKTPTPLLVADGAEYPERDGKPLADNTLQFQWITTIVGNLHALFQHNPNVFSAADLLWYPVEGDNKTRSAADAIVVFGRPKGHRGSYMQWNEDGIPPQVVFEVRSPGNSIREMTNRFRFYERFGVEEYDRHDADENDLSGWLRDGVGLEPIELINGWRSPRLNVRFELGGAEARIPGPDGRPVAGFEELAARAAHESARAARLAAQRRAHGIEPEA